MRRHDASSRDVGRGNGPGRPSPEPNRAQLIGEAPSRLATLTWRIRGRRFTPPMPDWEPQPSRCRRHPAARLGTRTALPTLGAMVERLAGCSSTVRNPPPIILHNAHGLREVTIATHVTPDVVGMPRCQPYKIEGRSAYPPLSVRTDQKRRLAKLMRRDGW